MDKYNKIREEAVETLGRIKEKLLKNIANSKNYISMVYQEIEKAPYNDKVDFMTQKYTSESLKSISDAIGMMGYKSMYSFVEGCNENDFQGFVAHSDHHSIINCLGQIENYIINH